jgi:hypothetical protein
MIVFQSATSDQKRRRLSGRFWPILLKKASVVFTAEKYAPEIEI